MERKKSTQSAYCPHVMRVRHNALADADHLSALPVSQVYVICFFCEFTFRRRKFSKLYSFLAGNKTLELCVHCFIFFHFIIAQHGFRSKAWPMQATKQFLPWAYDNSANTPKGVLLHTEQAHLMSSTVAGQTLLSNWRRHMKAPVSVKYWRLGTGKQNPIKR